MKISFGVSFNNQALLCNNLALFHNMKRKTSFPFAFLSTFRNFDQKISEVTMLGIKNKSIYFVLLSTFRNFGFAELTQHSEKLK